jgi:DNA-binding MarR family transcriptional regulator
MGRKKVLKQSQTTKGFALWQLSNQWQRGINNVLKSYDLTHVQYILIEGIIQLSEIYHIVTQNSVANHVNANIMMTSKVLRSLEEKGLVLRKSHDTDARANTIDVSKEGRTLYKKVGKSVKHYDDQFFSSLGSKINTFFNTVESLTEDTAS